MHVEEENYWHQRAHARWLLHGDLNTSYFQIANGRKRKNIVHSLHDNGILVEGTEKLLKHAMAYYKGLFGPASSWEYLKDFSWPLWGTMNSYMIVNMLILKDLLLRRN